MENPNNNEDGDVQRAAEEPAAPNHSYPFPTKKQIRERILADRAFALECVAVIQRRHERRQAGEAAAGPCGWMSSHASVGPKLAAKVADGEAAEEEFDKIRAMVCRYVKQIAVELRAAELQRRPELAATAALFGVSPTGAGVAPTAGGKAEQERSAGRRRTVADPSAPSEPPPEPQESDEGCAVCARVMDLLRAEDGRRSTDIAEALETTTIELAKHLRDLLDAGSVTKAGHGRGTRYHLA